MNKVKFNQVPLDQLESLQAGLDNYWNSLAENIKPQMHFNFYDDVQQMDLVNKMFRAFRNKVENRQRRYRITLSPAEAVALLYSCQNTENNNDRTTFSGAMAAKYKNEIDQQLKSSILWTQQTPNQLPVPPELPLLPARPNDGELQLPG
jgi:hypothetical protein